MSKKKHAHAHEPEHVHEHGHEDEPIHVPKGQSKTKFYMTMGLMLFMLLIFMVTGPMMAALTGGAGGPEEVMSWTHPRLGRQSINGAAFGEAKRGLARFQRLLGGRSTTPKDSEVAYWLIMRDLAADAGLRAPDEHVRNVLRQRWTDTQLYDNELQLMGMTKMEFEELLRTQLSIGYYQNMIIDAAAKPDPDKVQQRWINKNQEYAFDYVALPVEDVQDEARGELPEEQAERVAQLEEWFNGLTEARRNTYRTPVKVKAHLAWFALPIESAETAAKLMEKFPRPEFEEPQDVEDNYFSGYQFTRFRREEPLEIENPRDQEEVFAANYMTREEAQDQIVIEAPVFQSLDDWSRGMNERMAAGEEIDLIAEAVEHGMETLDDGVARSREEWANFPEEKKGAWLASELSRLEIGQTKVVVQTDRMYVIRPTVRIDPRMPEFSEITEKIEEDWVAERARTLALEKLNAIRDTFDGGPKEGEPFRPQVDADTFLLSCKEKGLGAEHRDWRRREFKLAADATDADRYFRFTASLYTLRVDGVAQPALSPDQKTAYLVRQAGIRDPEIESMKPADLAAARAEIAQEVRQDFEEKNLNSPTFFQQNYDYTSVWLTEG